MNSAGKSHINNKRVAKNTMLLYFRMLLTMVVSLYTIDIVLRVLGSDDFGVFEVVAGAVTMLSFLNGAMSSGTQRYMSVAIAKDDESELNRTFSATLSIHIAISIIVLIFAESYGLWFVNNVLNIPEDSIVAANWIYQFAIISYVITITQVPYNAMIVAHERMGVFAYISILEVVLKLVVILLLQYVDVNKLALYGGLLCAVTLIVGFIYRFYCLYKFPASRYKFNWEPDRFKELISYAGWNLWGTIAFVGSRQGLVLLVNIFFGTTVNAAQGIAYKVHITVAQFVGGFQMAMNPQLVKSYAAGHTSDMLKLMKRGVKLSFLLMYLIVVPIIFHMHYILNLWLPFIPEYTVVFCQLTLITSLIDSLAGPLMSAAHATGKIKLYQTLVGGVMLLNLPLAYLFVKLGYPPQSIFIVTIAVTVIAFFIRLYVLQRILPFRGVPFMKQVMVRPMVLCVVASVAYIYMTPQFSSIFEFAGSLVLVELGALALVVFIGVNSEERLYMYSKLRDVIKKKFS